MTDRELLAEYKRIGSQEAFAELTRRHVDWVHSAAVRQVRGAGGEASLAQDVTQAVFVVLATKAAALVERAGTEDLAPWLFMVLRHAAQRAVREEQRRKHREKEGAAMRKETVEAVKEGDEAWLAASPILDEVVGQLGDDDRRIVLLRFYEKRSHGEVGRQLGISDEAARKRVTRAVDKLRSLMARRGVVIAGAVLAALLIEETTKAAPPDVAVLAAKAATCHGCVLAQGVIKMMMRTKAKVVAGSVIILIALTGSMGLAWRMGQSAESVPATNPAATVAVSTPANATGRAGRGDGATPNAAREVASRGMVQSADPQRLRLAMLQPIPEIPNGTQVVFTAMLLNDQTRYVARGAAGKRDDVAKLGNVVSCRVAADRTAIEVSWDGETGGMPESVMNTLGKTSTTASIQSVAADKASFVFAPALGDQITGRVKGDLKLWKNRQAASFDEVVKVGERVTVVYTYTAATGEYQVLEVNAGGAAGR